MIEIKISGLKELKDALQKLPERVQKRVLRGATMAGAQVIKKAAKQRAPVGTVPHKDAKGRTIAPGNLRKSIIARAKKGASKTSVTVSVGPSSRGFYGMFHEFGTSKMAARPFLRPAFDDNKERAVEAIKERLSAGIEREANKLK